MSFVFFALIRAVFTMPQKMDTPALGRRRDLFSYVAEAPLQRPLQNSSE